MKRTLYKWSCRWLAALSINQRTTSPHHSRGCSGLTRCKQEDCVDVMDSQQDYPAFGHGDRQALNGSQSGGAGVSRFAPQTPTNVPMQGEQYGNISTQPFNTGHAMDWAFEDFQGSPGSDSQMISAMLEFSKSADEGGSGHHLFQGIHHYVKPAEAAPWFPGDGQQTTPAWKSVLFSTADGAGTGPSLTHSQCNGMSEGSDSGYNSAIKTDESLETQTSSQFDFQAVQREHDHYELLDSYSNRLESRKSLKSDHKNKQLQATTDRRNAVERARPKYEHTFCEIPDCGKRLKNRSEAKYFLPFTTKLPNLTMETGSIMSSTQSPTSVMSKGASARNPAPVSRQSMIWNGIGNRSMG